MNKQETENLVKVWEQSHKILREIRDLAEVNTFLAYAVIRQAETIIDIIVVRKADNSLKTPAESSK